MTGRWGITLAMLLAIGWISPLHAAPAEGSENSVASANIAVLVQGDVTVKRKGWTTYEPVVFGTNLRVGDLVRVDPSSHAKVVCSDLTVHELPVGIAGVPCNPAGNVLRSPNGSLISPTRSGPPDGSYPVVVSPRRTKLLSSNPTIQWTPATGVDVYVVEVRGPKFFWSIRAPITPLVYPADAPRLKPGVDYKVIVKAGERSSSEEPGIGLGFSILDGKEGSNVEKEEQRIESLGLSDGPTQFLIASLYTANDLRAEAIQRLEKVSPRMNAGAVARLLGDLYLEVGLTRQAEDSYLKALELSKTENDLEGQMLMHLALGNIYAEALGNNKLAREHLDAALVLANQIGDENTGGLAGSILANLKREGV